MGMSKLHYPVEFMSRAGHQAERGWQTVLRVCLTLCLEEFERLQTQGSRTAGLIITSLMCMELCVPFFAPIPTNMILPKHTSDTVLLLTDSIAPG